MQTEGGTWELGLGTAPPVSEGLESVPPGITPQLVPSESPGQAQTPALWGGCPVPSPQGGAGGACTVVCHFPVREYLSSTY